MHICGTGYRSRAQFCQPPFSGEQQNFKFVFLQCPPGRIYRYQIYQIGYTTFYVFICWLQVSGTKRTIQARINNGFQIAPHKQASLVLNMTTWVPLLMAAECRVSHVFQEYRKKYFYSTVSSNHNVFRAGTQIPTFLQLRSIIDSTDIHKFTRSTFLTKFWQT